MLELDWPSFGYGAGALAVSTYVWSARGLPMRALAAYRRRRALARFHRSVNAKALRELRVHIDTVETRAHNLEKQLMITAAGRKSDHERAEEQIAKLTLALAQARMQDEKWRKYKKRQYSEQAETIHDGKGGTTFWTRRP